MSVLDTDRDNFNLLPISSSASLNHSNVPISNRFRRTPLHPHTSACFTQKSHPIPHMYHRKQDIPSSANKNKVLYIRSVNEDERMESCTSAVLTRMKGWNPVHPQC